MCHDHFISERALDELAEQSESKDDDEDALAELDGGDTTHLGEEPIPPLQADDEPDEDLDILTDGGD